MAYPFFLETILLALSIVFNALRRGEVKKNAQVSVNLEPIS